VSLCDPYMLRTLRRLPTRLEALVLADVTPRLFGLTSPAATSFFVLMILVEFFLVSV